MIVPPSQALPFRTHHLTDGELLVSRRYSLYVWPVTGDSEPRLVARYAGPATVRLGLETIPLMERLLRGGIHLARHTKKGSIVAFIKGMVLFAARGDRMLSPTFPIPGGARPLAVAECPDGTLLFGQYGNNPERREISVFASQDGGEHWDVAYTFPPRRIRHVHGVQYDPHRDGVLVLTGDEDDESGVYLTTDSFRTLEPLARGTQQARAVSVIPLPDGWIVPSDTPAERNHIGFLDLQGHFQAMAQIPGSSFSTCQTQQGLFVSTGVEPSKVNLDPYATIWASKDGASWECIFRARKDRYPGRLFQYGNLLFPYGLEESDRLYATGLALTGLHHKTLAWDPLP